MDQHLIMNKFFASLLIIVLASCAPTLREFTPSSKNTLISGVYKSGSNMTEPRPVESKYLKVNTGGVVIIRAGAGLFLNVAVKEKPTKDLYLVIEYENPQDPNAPLVNDQVFFKNAEKFVFSSPSTIRGLKSFGDYKITVKIYDSKQKKELLDTLTQKVRSYANTTTDKVFVYRDIVGGLK